MRTLVASVFALIVLCGSNAANAAWEDLEKCYQKYGQVEETTSGNKRTTVYKDPADVAAECNAQVVKRATSESNQAKILELAGVIGRNSNWASAMPVYVVAAKKFPKSVCAHADVAYALGDALARPAEDAPAKSGAELMAACWPDGKSGLIALLKEDQNGYVKQNVCNFLKSKKAVPPEKREICDG